MFSHLSGSCPCWMHHQHKQGLFSRTKKSNKALKEAKMAVNPYEIWGTLFRIFRAHCQYKCRVTTNLLDGLPQRRWREAGRWQQGGGVLGASWGQVPGEEQAEGAATALEAPSPTGQRGLVGGSSSIPAARPGMAAQQNWGPDSRHFQQQGGCAQDESNLDTTASSSWEQGWAASESRWPETTELLDPGHGCSRLQFSSKTRLRSCTTAVGSWPHTTIHHPLRCAPGQSDDVPLKLPSPSNRVSPSHQPGHRATATPKKLRKAVLLGLHVLRHKLSRKYLVEQTTSIISAHHKSFIRDPVYPIHVTQ